MHITLAHILSVLVLVAVIAGLLLLRRALKRTLDDAEGALGIATAGALETIPGALAAPGDAQAPSAAQTACVSGAEAEGDSRL